MRARMITSKYRGVLDARWNYSYKEIINVLEIFLFLDANIYMYNIVTS